MKTPIYKSLANQLIHSITTGKYPVGSYLPKELDICEQFKVSRQTVRAAIALLEQRKFVSRKKRAGTKVESIGDDNSYSYDLNSINDLIHLAKTYQRELMAHKEIIVDDLLHQTTDLPLGGHFICMESIRLDDKNKVAPFLYTRMYLPADYKKVVNVIKNNPKQLAVLIVEELSKKLITSIEQKIKTMRVDKKIAHILKLQQNDVRLCISRRYFSEDKELLLLSYSIHHDQDFSYNITLHRK